MPTKTTKRTVSFNYSYRVFVEDYFEITLPEGQEVTEDHILRYLRDRENLSVDSDEVQVDDWDEEEEVEDE